MSVLVEEHLRTALSGYRRIEARAAALDAADRQRGTRLTGWTAADLLEHVTWAAAMQASAVLSATGTPDGGGPAGQDLAGAVDLLERASRAQLSPQASLALPDGTVPGAFAAALFAFEACVHHADLVHAVDGRDPDFTPDELAACSVVLGPMLHLLATRAAPAGPPGHPGDDLVIDLLGLADTRLTRRDGRWHVGVPGVAAPDTTVRGTPDQVVLFACGRLDTSHLQVSGDASHAYRFKTWFPGP